MIVEPLTIPIAKNGLNRDLEPTSLKGAYSPYMQNMQVRPSSIAKRMGYSAFGYNLPLSGVGSELIEYVDARGDVHLIAITTTHAYELNATSLNWTHITPSVDLDECEAGWTKGQAADTVAHVTTSFIRGAKSMKLTLGAGRSNGDQLAYKDISSVDIRTTNITGKTGAATKVLTHIGFWIKSSIALAAEALEIVVSESNHASGEKTGTYVESLSTALTADTWTFVSVAETLTDFNAVLSVSLYADATIASGTIIHLDDIRAYCEFTGGVDHRWSHAEATDVTRFNGNGGHALCICNSSGDGIFYYEGESGDVFQQLDMSDFASFSDTKEIEEFWNHFFCLNYNNANQNVKSLAFADFGNIVNYTGGTSDSSFLSDSRGAIIRAEKLGSDMIIYSAKSITTTRYLGLQVIFAFPTLVYETGLYCPKGIWGFVNVHYILGTDQKIYGYAGGRQLIPVGKAIEDSLFAELDASKKQRTVLGLDAGRHKLYFFIPKVSDTYALTYYALNHKMVNMPWEYGRFAHAVRDFSVFENAANWYCDDADITDLYCDEQSFYCDSAYSVSGNPIAVFISSNGYVYRLDSTASDAGSDIEAIYDTEEVTPDGEYTQCRWQRLYFTAKADISSSTVQIYYSILDGADWSEWVELVNDSPVTLTNTWTTYDIGVDVLARKIKFRFYQNSKKDLQIRDPMTCEYTKETARG